MDQYYVVTPLNINYRAGDSGGDWTINPAPEADYYTDKEVAVAAAKVLNAETLGPRTEENNTGALNEEGAFVVQIVWYTS